MQVWLALQSEIVYFIRSGRTAPHQNPHRSWGATRLQPDRNRSAENAWRLREPRMLTASSLLSVLPAVVEMLP